MKSFTMSWESLGLKVTCDAIAENRAAFDIFCANLPIEALQGHEVTGGWMLRDRSVHFRKKPFDIPASQLKSIPMDKAPEGCVCLLFAQGGSAELVTKYDECVDQREYIPIAQVRAGDMEALKEAGKAAWKSASRTKEIIVSKMEGVE